MAHFFIYHIWCNFLLIKNIMVYYVTMYSNDLRNIAIRLSQTQSFRKVAQLLFIGASTICRWSHLKGRQQRKTRRGKLHGREVIDALTVYILLNPFATLKNIQQMIFTIFQINVSVELVRLAIIKNAYTKKRARYYSQPKDDKEKLDEFLCKP